MSEAEATSHERKEAVMTRVGALETCVVRHPDVEGAFTEEDGANIRLLMVTSERADALRRARWFAKGSLSDADTDADTEEDEEAELYFNTSSGNDVVFGIKEQVENAIASNLTKKFDELCMLTFALLTEDMWASENDACHDNEEMQSACENLAATWKKLLGDNTDADLGIDEEFTKPGVLAMLEDLETMLKEQGEKVGVKYPFEWRP